MAKALIDTGAPVDGHPGEPETLLITAASYGDAEVARVLVAAGTPVNQADAERGRLPLHTAAGNGRLASVRRLLAHGADPNLRDARHHHTPLEECQPANQDLDNPSHDEVAAILRPLTREQDPDGQPSGT